MTTTETVGFAHYLAQSDGLGRAIFIILVVMSAFSWYLVVVKAIQAIVARIRSRRFVTSFWNAPSIAEVERRLEDQHPDEPFSHLAYHAIIAARHHARHSAHRLNEAGTTAEFVSRSIRRVIDEETSRVEWGLTLLASIGSTAPFVGLFGTVWGVYHALAAIGMSGQGTLDKIAGPVGEALIMTGAGLAVAVPAVLAYNAFVRSNRVLLARLDAFAHDVYSLLTTGAAYATHEEVPRSSTRPLREVGASHGVR